MSFAACCSEALWAGRYEIIQVEAELFAEDGHVVRCDVVLRVKGVATSLAELG